MILSPNFVVKVMTTRKALQAGSTDFTDKQLITYVQSARRVLKANESDDVVVATDVRVPLEAVITSCKTVIKLGAALLRERGVGRVAAAIPAPVWPAAPALPATEPSVADAEGAYPRSLRHALAACVEGMRLCKEEGDLVGYLALKDQRDVVQAHLDALAAAPCV